MLPSLASRSGCNPLKSRCTLWYVPSSRFSVPIWPTMGMNPAQKIFHVYVHI
jgi:hypothetical protein